MDPTMLILLVGLMAMMIVPQLLNRRKQKKREAELQPGDKIMTIGGFIGELVYINFEENLARVKLADGVVVELITGAISGKRQESEPAEETEETGDADSEA